jgi:hypothetical protein
MTTFEKTMIYLIVNKLIYNKEKISFTFLQISFKSLISKL